MICIQAKLFLLNKSGTPTGIFEVDALMKSHLTKLHGFELHPMDIIHFKINESEYSFKCKIFCDIM